MRVDLALIIFLSSIAVMVYVVALGIDQLYALHNRHNLYIMPTHNGPNASQKVLLLPQLDATIGLVTACVGHNCFSRSGHSGVQGLVAATLGNQSFPATAAKEAQARLEHEFWFGYDAALHCGNQSKKLQRVAGFGYAAYVLSLVFFIGACGASLLFCFLVGDIDVLAGTPSLDRNSNVINVDDLGLSGIYLMLKLKRHLVHEGPLLISVLMLSGLAFFFSVCGMGVTLAVKLSTSKCGVSVCSSFESSMKGFFGELSRLNMVVSPTPTYSCRTGPLFALSIVGFVLGFVCLILACFLFGWVNCSRRRKDMLSLRDQLYRLADVQGLIGTIAGNNGDTPFPPVQSRQVSGAASTGSTALSPGGGVGWGASGNVIPHDRGASSVSVGARKSSGATLHTIECDGRQARSVGARIELYRMLKQFMCSEDRARKAVEMQEKLEFYSLLSMRECAWYSEELCLLHEFTLNWFVGPVLDLCVLETNERQLIIEEFNVFESGFLKNIAAGCVTPDEPAQAWERGGPLAVAESARLSQQVAHWQQVQTEMAPLLLQTASYIRADTPPLASKSPQPRKTGAVLQLASVLSPYACAPVLDTDCLLAILDRLRGSKYDNVAFLTHYASSLLVPRSTNAITTSGDDTSFSSNVFSNPSFAPLRCEDFTVPTDNVRIHLVKAAHPTRKLPRPPPRLHTLPQYTDSNESTSAKGSIGHGAGGRSRSSASNNRPGGRSPSPQARSPAATSSLAQAGVGREDQVYATMRPFSSRDGTSSGRSPFQAAFAAHNAAVASLGNAATSIAETSFASSFGEAGEVRMSAIPERDGVTTHVNTSPTTFANGSAWRFTPST
jgi:hypothetical protein